MTPDYIPLVNFSEGKLRLEVERHVFKKLFSGDFHFLLKVSDD